MQYIWTQSAEHWLLYCVVSISSHHINIVATLWKVVKQELMCACKNSTTVDMVANLASYLLQ